MLPLHLSFKGDGSTGSPTITVSITPAGTNYFSGTGHYYEIVNSTKHGLKQRLLLKHQPYTVYLVILLQLPLKLKMIF